MQLEGYCERIGFSGKLEPSFETLAALHRLHPQSIPFENIDPFLGRYNKLDIDAIWRKLVAGGRGGWCFEHNTLFAYVLRTIGFNVRCLGAQVRWNQLESARPSRVHMVLGVYLNGEWLLADVGFGGLTLTGPLRMSREDTQTTPHGNFRIVKVDDELLLQAELRNTWKDLYRFDMQIHEPADYEVFNYFLSTHDTSPFRAVTMAGRVTPEGRFALMNNRLSYNSHDGETWQKHMQSEVELHQAISEVFFIDLPPGDHRQLSLRLLNTNIQ